MPVPGVVHKVLPCPSPQEERGTGKGSEEDKREIKDVDQLS